MTMRRKNADPNKGVAFRKHIVAASSEMIKKKMSSNYANEKKKQIIIVKNIWCQP